jgi:hypothetical protein
MRQKSSSSGQAAVEFALFTFFLFLMLFVVIQITMIGISKWQFAHFANYSARVWSVQRGQSANASAIRVQGVASIFDWNLTSGRWVAPIIVTSSNTSRDGVTGVVYSGQGPVLSMYRGWIGDRGGLPGFINVPNATFFIYQSFIPMVKEPDERPGQHDNDCSDTPCTRGNGR